MLRSIKDMHGYTIQAGDGQVGEVYEFFFDDETWTIRYLVVETGTGEALIPMSRAVIRQVDVPGGRIEVHPFEGLWPAGA